MNYSTASSPNHATPVFTLDSADSGANERAVLAAKNPPRKKPVTKNASCNKANPRPVSNLGPTLEFDILEREHKKAVIADFSGGELTGNAGLVMVAKVDRTTGLSHSLAASLVDCRQPGKVIHSLESQLRTRLGAIAMDYVDCNVSVK